MDFQSIVGHEKTIAMLQRSIENDALSHSYLFEGESGIGKRMLAQVFAKTLLCRKGGTVPCNSCISCYKVDEGHHPDLFMLEPEKNLIRRAEIDRLISEAKKAPFESRKKVFIIDESDKMNVESKNALLKTLEEPPAYVHIILVSSNPNNLLATILSRVESIKFYPVNQGDIAKLLQEEYGSSEDQASFIASFTKGAIGKSISIAGDEDFFEKRDRLVRIIDDLVHNDLTRAFSSKDFFEEAKEEIDDLLDLIIYWFRDLLIYKELGETDLIINRDKIDILSGQSYMNFKKINDIIDNIQETKMNIRRNVNYQLAIEVMLINIGGK